MKPLEDRHSRLDQCLVILREISYRGFVTPDNFSATEELTVVAAGLAEFSLGNGGRIREQRIHERGLAGAVAPHECNLFSADYARREISNYFGVAVRLGDTLQLKNMFP